MLLVMLLSQSCASIGARSDGLYPRGAIYPGVRAYARDTVSLIRNDPSDQNYKREFGREPDIALIIVFAPVWMPDYFVFTPVADTIMLPYDLYQKITSIGEAQQSPSDEAQERTPEE